MLYLLLNLFLTISSSHVNLIPHEKLISPPKTSKKYRQAMIGFYNLENLFDTIRDYRIFDQDFTPDGAYHYNSKVYWHKLANLSWVISNMGIDKYSDGVGILGVAEIENRQVLQDLISMPALKKRGYKIIHQDGHDMRGIDVALLYRPKYFAPYSYSSIPVLLPKRKNKQHGHYSRDILWVSGLLAPKDTAHIFVIHLPSRLGGAKVSEPSRIFVVKKVRKIIDSIMNISPKHKFIVMGDMNDNPNNKSMHEILGGIDRQDDFPNHALFNPFYAIYDQGIGTLVYKDVWFLFDQILLSAQFLNNNSLSIFKHAYIFNPIPLTESLGKHTGYPKRTFINKIYNEGYSDHYPVYVILKFPSS